MDERVRIRERPVSIEHPGHDVHCANCGLRVPIPNGTLDRIFLYRYQDRYYCRPSCVSEERRGQTSFDI